MRTRTSRSYPDLKTWRKAKEMSQREAADFLGISQTTYTRLERRIRFVKGRAAAALQDKTNVPLEVLVGADRV